MNTIYDYMNIKLMKYIKLFGKDSVHYMRYYYKNVGKNNIMPTFTNRAKLDTRHEGLENLSSQDMENIPSIANHEIELFGNLSLVANDDYVEKIRLLRLKLWGEKNVDVRTVVMLVIMGKLKSIFQNLNDNDIEY